MIEKNAELFCIDKENWFVRSKIVSEYLAQQRVPSLNLTRPS